MAANHPLPLRETLPDALLRIAAADGRILEANERACRLLGYSRETLYQLRIQTLEDAADAQAYWSSRLAGRSLDRIRETRLRRADGTVQTVEITTADADRVPLTSIWAAIRQTGRRAVDEALKARERILESIFHTLPIGIGLTRERVIQEVNDGFCGMLGYRREELIGQSARIIYADDAEFERVGREKYARIREMGHGEIETRFRCKDGHLIEVLLGSNLLDRDDLGAGVTFTVTDITERNRALREIEAERALAEQYLEVARIMLLALDREGRVTLINPKGCEVIGRSAPEILGRPWIDTFVPDTASERARAIFSGLLSGEKEGLEYVETPLRDAQGRERIIAWHNSVLREADGTIVGTLSSGEDVTEQQAAQRALGEERSFLEHIMDGIEDIILVIDRSHRVLRMNKAARAKAVEEGLIGANCHCYELLYGIESPCLSQERVCPLTQVLQTNQSCQALHRVTDAEGREHTFEVSASPLRDDQGVILAVIEIVRDVTRHQELMERLRLQDLRYAHLAHHDPLTDLPNRALFSDRLNQAVQTAQRSHAKLAVLLLDLDQFKQVNDSFDHSDGDAVLVALTQRLQLCLRGADTIARMGGDEFSIILTELEHDEDAARVARMLLNLFKRPFEIREHRLFLGASIGISLYPEHGTTTDDLVRNADAALFRAKAEGRNSFQYYSQELTTKAFERILLESSLHDAIANRELVLHYQPLLHLGTMKACGVEALLRWQHPSMGLVSPDRFIPLAEATGLIVEMGAWVLLEACAQMHQWREADLLPADALLSVNLSPRQLAHEALIEEVQRALATTGLPAANLELEITEGSVMASPEASAQRLGRLRDLGVKIAIDDFGTGYSSLAYLKRLPLTKLKIDRSFVSDIPRDTNDMAITRAIIALAKTLGLEVLAEGIETESQLDFLVQESCEKGQGYLFSRPLPVADLTRYLTDAADD